MEAGVYVGPVLQHMGVQEQAEVPGLHGYILPIEQVPSKMPRFNEVRVLG